MVRRRRRRRAPIRRSGDQTHLAPPLQRLAEERSNKLNKREYDETTWAARTWRSFAVQQLSVSVHRSVSLEIAHALGLSGAADERPVA